MQIYKINISISFDSKFTGVEYDDKLLTVPSSTPSFEPELRFLRAKVKILTGEIDKQKDDQKKRVFVSKFCNIKI